jgi:hypothetical protein
LVRLRLEQAGRVRASLTVPGGGLYALGWAGLITKTYPGMWTLQLIEGTWKVDAPRLTQVG